MMRSTWIKALAIAAGAFLCMQLIPVGRSNPPVTGEIDAPEEVMAILERSCYDCHSNETEWPWYSRVAPVSWMVSSDVSLGRKMLNFSEWDSTPVLIKEALITGIADEVEKGDMPRPMYLWLHPDAALTEEQIRILTDWAETMEKRHED